jgi:hypothetical protein
MKIFHKISVGWSNEQKRRAFESIGIVFGDGYVTVDLEEQDERWPKAQILMNELGLTDTLYTKFSSSEISSAPELVMQSSWHHGYPEPSDDFGYLEKTFRASENPHHCRKCGVGASQVAPFRMKKEPVWGSKNILQMNWEFGQFFVKPFVWEGLFKPFGVDSLPVLADKSGNKLDTVVQIIIPSRVELSDMHRFARETCSVCGRTKYLPISFGYWPRPVSMHGDIAKSAQYFGSGGSANQRVWVSHKFYAAAKSFGLKGVSFVPCEPAPSHIEISQ